MKLHYYISDSFDEHCYSIRRKRLREVNTVLADDAVEWGSPWQQRYGKPRKVVIDYRDAFDLLFQATGEGGLDEGTPALKRIAMDEGADCPAVKNARAAQRREKGSE